AFLIGLFRLLLLNPPGERKNPQPRALILAPTRELALQIYNDACMIGKHCKLEVAIAYGGTDYEKQRNRIAEGVDILIGTPGRLIDYFKQGVFNLKQIESVVLDEADRMFDLGFISDIRYLLRRMPAPEKRLSMLFSATLSHRVMELAYEHMNNPENVKTDVQTITADGINQTLYHPSSEEKIPLLIGLLRHLSPARSMIFVNTKRAGEKVEAFLKGNDFECGLLSGDVRQNKRQRILRDFANGQLPILIATDVAARGLHIDNVSHVFNYDLPQNAEDYVHRIGRTARAGKTGEAISFACDEYAFSLIDIEQYIGKSISTAPISDDLLVTPKPPQRKPRSTTARKKRSGHDDQKGGTSGKGRRRNNRRPKAAEAKSPE
ncbi:MAG: DEAD/DEAH box helicase, partial [Gammaproteobacteria bacterium]|nr:DEAD/DEAH box helicase [Gammaproteobacteria bacterium]